MSQQETPAPETESTSAFPKARLWLMCAAAALAILIVLFGSLPLKIVAAVLALCIIQGLWRGAAELVGIVAGMIAGVLLCRPIGRLLEPMLASATSTSGLSSRLLSAGLAAVLISAIASIAIGIVTRRLLKRRPQLAGADKLAGGAIGLFEGCFLGLIVLWVPLALEPVAVGQIGKGEAPEQRPRNPVAEAVVNFAEQVKGSSLGGVAESTNPMEGARLFALTGDFAIVMRHRRAREHFVNSNAMKHLREAPSVQEAISRLEKDPELGAMIRSGDYGPEFVRGVLTSKSLMDTLDQTTIVKDLTPLVGEIEKALQEAKKIALGTP